MQKDLDEKSEKLNILENKLKEYEDENASLRVEVEKFDQEREEIKKMY